MEREDWEIEALEEDAKTHRSFMSELCDQIDKVYRTCEQEDIVVTCPWCDGEGTDGYDRSFPPNKYICQVCGGSGQVKLMKTEKAEI
jgi:DnaJ-class molecular chaperone